MPPYVLDRARWGAKHARHHILHSGAKLDVPVIDAGNPLGKAVDFPGVVEADGQIRVQVPADQAGGPGQFTIELHVPQGRQRY